MIPPSNCPYKGLSALPCWSCPHHNADMNTCCLQLTAQQNPIGEVKNCTSLNNYRKKTRGRY